MLYSHDHYTYTYTCRKTFNTIRTSEDTSLEKYTSHFIERVVSEREFETEQRLQHIDPPTLLAITAFISRSPGLLNRGPGGPASLGQGPHSSIFSPTATAQSGAWGPSLLGAGSLYRILAPTNLIFLYTELYYCFTSTQFNLSTVKIIPLKPSTGCTCYLHRCISYFDSLARVNMQQYRPVTTLKI